MHASRPKHRPPTVWLKEAPNKNQSPLLSPSPLSEPAPVTSAARPASDPSAQPLTNESPALAIRHVTEDPWQTYEAIIEIFQTERVFLARHRRNKAELVHVQRLEQSPSVAALRETISQLSHPSFRTLLETYHHANHAFLVWEPVALSVSQVLASKCLVTESEILAIVRPVLEGIRHLRDRGRVLATLSADTILLTDAGGVRIAGAEHSCKISLAEMDAATSKLFALAEVVTKLMQKNPPPHQWSAEITSLPNQLRSKSIEELLQSNIIGGQTRHDGELKLLVCVANKTAYHRVESFSDRL
ncbi:hypothetical protein NUH16_003230 [Penicillium rubens]|nr:hypothetical protein NUH16_003230 [Penicillium rubens]